MSLSDLRRLKLSINCGIIDKNAANPLAFVEGFENVELTPDELMSEIAAGHSICAQLKGPRRTANFLAADVACVDVDRGLTLDEALGHPLVTGHALLLHTTASHTSEHNRFRVLFALPRTVENPAEMKALLRSLALRLSGDPAATDPTRIFFGNRAAKFWTP
jgi:hypothetical protein